MGLLEEKRLVDARLQYKRGSINQAPALAWIDEYDGTLHFDTKQMEKKEDYFEVCKWYVETYPQL